MSHIEDLAELVRFLEFEECKCLSRVGDFPEEDDNNRDYWIKEHARYHRWAEAVKHEAGNKWRRFIPQPPPPPPNETTTGPGKPLDTPPAGGE